MDIIVALFLVLFVGGSLSVGVYLTLSGLLGILRSERQKPALPVTQNVVATDIASRANDSSLEAVKSNEVESANSGQPKVENETLKLLTPAPEERLQGWLQEFYGKQVTISRRELLRHRDLSLVERLWIADALPETLIYKLVLPPWDIEQDLHERILIPSISSSARLFLSAHLGDLTALFIEDLGTDGLLNAKVDAELAAFVGRELAKLHRAYSYRVDELMQLNVLRTLVPLDYEKFVIDMCSRLTDWKLIEDDQRQKLIALAGTAAKNLAGEPISLVHGDLYAEDLLTRGGRLFIIDWSWFTMIGVPVMDLATLTMKHHKNEAFADWRDTVIDAYCFESGRQSEDVIKALPYAEALGRLLFLDWLVERRGRGIMGTTVGPVDDLIKKVIVEVIEQSAKML